MNWLVIFVILICTFFLALPTIFRLVFIYLLGFNQAKMKLKHPFQFVGIALQLDNPLWGITMLTIYIPKIQIKASLRSLKVNIILTKPKIMLNQNFHQNLQPIRMLESNQESKILHNLITIIKNQKVKSIPRSKQKSSLQSKNNDSPKSRGVFVLKAATQFIVLLMLQFIEITVENCELCLVTPLPESENEMKKKFQKGHLFREMLMLEQCTTEYLLIIHHLSISASVQDNYELEILMQCPTIRILTAYHLQQTLLCGQNTEIRIHLPFTFSFDETLKRIKVKSSIRNIECSVTPVDLQEIFHLFNKIFFHGCTQEEQKQNFQKEDIFEEVYNIQKNIMLVIKQARIRIKELAEPDNDNSQARKYLSNIAFAELFFQNLSMKEKDTKIAHAKLVNYKYNIIDGNEELFLGEKEKGDNVGSLIERDILELNNLSISTESSKNILIEHDDVVVTCQKEEVALLGKLFTVINDRLSCEEYSTMVYDKYFRVVSLYTSNKIGLEQCIIRMLDESATQIDSTNNKIDEQQRPFLFNRSGQQTSIIYNPKHLQFFMNISSLEHRINLTGSQYKQKRYYDSSGRMQINHYLFFNRIHMQYEGIKEFHVSQFKLFYNQSPELNELSIFTDDIHMAQNYQTLKDYLGGFVTFKQLLQIDDDDDDDDQDEETEKYVGKVSKKTVRLHKIVLNYGEEVAIIRKLQIDKHSGVNGKLVQLYFSLGKCDIIISKSGQNISKIAAVHPRQAPHTLFTLSSVTIKTFLSIEEAENTPQRQKSMIHIKSPILLLPETSIAANISQRVVEYIRIFNRLEPYFTAYIMNKSREKVRMIRNSYKNFMINSNQNLIKITNIMIGIQDEYLDRAMLNRMRFYRDYYRYSKTYNQSELLNYLKQTMRVYSLFELKINSFSIQMKPVSEVASNPEQTVQLWVNNLRKQRSNLEQSCQPPSSVRLIRAKNIRIECELKSMSLTVRDYPLPLMVCTNIKGFIQKITTKNIYEESNNYVRSSFQLGQIQCNVGLCLLSGLREIYKNMKKYEIAINKYKNTDEFLESLKNKKSLDRVRFKPYWHVLHRSACWQVSIQKKSEIKMKILTGLNPYSSKNIRLLLGPIKFDSNPERTITTLEYLKLNTNKFLIFQISQLSFKLQTKYFEPFLQLWLDIHIKTGNNDKNCNMLTVSDQIIQDLSKIKQLKSDWLIIYQLVQPSSKKQERFLQQNDDEQNKYLGLFKLAANMQLKNKEKELSIFSVINKIHFVCHIDDFYLELADSSNNIEFIMDKFSIKVQLAPIAEEWKMRFFISQFDNVLGRVKILKNKILGSESSAKRFLQLFHSIDEDHIKNNIDDIELLKEVFFVARNSVLKLRRYAEVSPNQLFYVYKQLSIENIKIELSVELKKVVEYLTSTLLFEANKKIKQLQEKKQYFKETPLQKFRHAVITVMRANRRKKKPMKSIKLFIKVNNIEIGLKTNKRLLLLTTRENAQLIYNRKFREEDRYQIDPRIQIDINFSALEVWLDQHPNHLWLLGRKYSPNHYLEVMKILEANRVKIIIEKQQETQIPQQYLKIVDSNDIERETNIKSYFSEGRIILTRDNLWVLREISELMIDLVDNRERKFKLWEEWRDKYAEMIQYSRQLIKNKLSWVYNDRCKMQSVQTLQFNLGFTLDEFDVLLMEKKSQESQQLAPFLKLQSKNIETKINVFKNNKSVKQFIIHKLKIINCQEPSDSDCSTFLEIVNQQELPINFMITQYQLRAYDEKVLWTFIEKAIIHFNPLRIRITEEIYSSIYMFFFGTKPQEQNSQQQEIQSYTPDFYMNFIIDEVKVQVWYRTESLIKRLEGVNIEFEKYQMKEQFVSQQGAFDKWVHFMAKQLASQFFNVIGQKLFG